MGNTESGFFCHFGKASVGKERKIGTAATLRRFFACLPCVSEVKEKYFALRGDFFHL